MNLPSEFELYRVWPWVSVPSAIQGRDLARIAHHEAGHIVLMEWAGLVPLDATATDERGVARFDPLQAMSDAQSHEYNRPLAAAQAASIFHAGIVAELIYAGLTWQGLTVRLNSDDWGKAQAILKPHFGHHGSAGHGYAQRLALAVLKSEAVRFKQIAAQLIAHGEWRPEDAVI